MLFFGGCPTGNCSFGIIMFQITQIRCVFEGFMLKCSKVFVFLDSDIAICVRGASDNSNLKMPHLKQPEKGGHGRRYLVAFVLFSFGELRMIISIVSSMCGSFNLKTKAGVCLRLHFSNPERPITPIHVCEENGTM